MVEQQVERTGRDIVKEADTRANSLVAEAKKKADTSP